MPDRPYALGDAADAVGSFFNYLRGRKKAPPPPAPAPPPPAPDRFYAPAAYVQLVKSISAEYKLDPHLLDSMTYKESSWNPKARGAAGEYGLTQLMPGTVKMLKVQQPLDPEQNLRGGAAYLAQLLTRFKGDVPTALAAYNAGPTGSRFGTPAQQAAGKSYADAVLALQRKLR